LLPLEQFFGGLGIYQHLVDFAGAGATVPLTGFGNLLAKGAIKKVQEIGLVGAFTGGTVAAAGRNFRSSILWIYCIINFKTKNKETIKEKWKLFARRKLFARSNFSTKTNKKGIELFFNSYFSFYILCIFCNVCNFFKCFHIIYC